MAGLDAPLIVAFGTSAASVLAGTAALVKTLRTPTRADVLARVERLETQVAGLVRWYVGVRVESAAQGVDLPAIPAALLRST